VLVCDCVYAGLGGRTDFDRGGNKLNTKRGDVEILATLLASFLVIHYSSTAARSGLSLH